MPQRRCRYQTAEDAEQRQPAVPEIEHVAELERFAVLHEVLDGEDDDDVGHREPEGGPGDVMDVRLGRRVVEGRTHQQLRQREAHVGSRCSTGILIRPLLSLPSAGESLL